MKKIFTILFMSLLALNASAELGYGVVFTQSDFNSSSTTIKKEGTIEWDNDHVRCGGSSNGISLGGPSWNWDDKYFDVKLANGVPQTLTFEWACNNITSTEANWYVKESADNKNWSEVWSTTSSYVTWTEVKKDLKPGTRYLRFCFSGNFAGNFKNIKITEKILMGTPNPTAIDFDTVKVDDAVDAQTFKLGWTNLVATATSSDGHITVTPNEFGSIGAYTQTQTLTVGLLTTEAGEYNATITVSGRNKSAEVTVKAVVEKHDQSIAWNPAETYNYGETIALATANSGLDVTYDIPNSDVLVFENGSFRAVHGGTVTIIAKQAGNYKYNAAPSVERTITIVPPTTYGDFNQTTCGEAVTFNSVTYNETTNTDVNVGENYLGGDSIVHVAITINQPTASSETKTIVIGAEETWNGYDLSEKTVGQHELQFTTTNVAGCDSVVTLALTVNKQETLQVPVNFEFCAGNSETFRGVEYNETGTFNVAAAGDVRDTTYIITVTVNQPTASSETKTIVIGAEETWNGYDLSEKTVGQHELQFTTTNVAGCDSVVTLALTVNKQETLQVPVNFEFCAGGSETFRGVEYNEAGTFNVAATGDVRDTTYIITVTVNQPTASSETKTIVIGAEETWNGYDLSEKTVGQHELQFTTTNVAGCDSVVTLALTVNKQETLQVPVNFEFCAGGSETFRGVEYNEAGTFNVAATGDVRDTTYIITVTVNQPTASSETKTIVIGAEENWNGYDLSEIEVGNFELKYTTTNAAGCDSVVTLNLIVNKLDILQATQELAFCAGDSVEYRGKWYFEEGTDVVNVQGDIRDTLVAITITVFETTYEERFDTVKVGDIIDFGDIEWTLGEEIITGSQEVKEEDLGEHVFEYIGQTENGCEAIIKFFVLVEPKDDNAIDQITIDHAQTTMKYLRNGQLFIQRGGRIFNAAGQVIR